MNNNDQTSDELAIFLSLCSTADRKKIKSRTLTYNDFDRLNLIIDRLGFFDPMMFLAEQYPEYVTKYIDCQTGEDNIEDYPNYYHDEIYPLHQKWIQDFYAQLSPKNKKKYDYLLK